MPHKKRPEWLVPAGLLLLSAVPVAAGSARVAELAGGARVTADNARFFAMPLPVVLHIFGASLFCVLGAFQFVPSLRRRRWHRVSGRLLVPCGLVAALSGLWMTLFSDLPPGDGDLLTVFRLFFGTAMAVSIVLATLAIRRRDVRRHRVWMTRGYAIGLGAGTQVLTHVPWALLVGAPGEFTRAMLMAAGWVINLVVAEWALRRRPTVRAAAKPAARLT
ncbi:putative membrane protein [Amycolatopsis lexingtonensis]|uniref:Membrane protein n=1 Tax=Amycolatopsis lexingtonensis TaxID=218822 RepID=A0ABR9IFA1_9PSEU|nr:DUF2306 domain-containing protein [Amycolatopsis lexingtonensis]MBE1501850.1 putative membrane protein [Amycolatopsis lexingtonensis]